MEKGGWDARVLANPCSWFFLAHRSGPFLVGPSLSVPQLELPPSSQVEFFRGRTLGALECSGASAPPDQQSELPQPSLCSLSRDRFPPAQAQVVLPCRGGGQSAMQLGGGGGLVGGGEKGSGSRTGGVFQMRGAMGPLWVSGVGVFK